MANKVLIKKSTIAGKAPTATDLDIGELGINTADRLIYSKHSDGTIFSMGSSGGQMLGSASVKAISYGSKVIAENITIDGSINASAIGPLTLATGYNIVIGDGAHFVIIG